MHLKALKYSYLAVNKEKLHEGNHTDLERLLISIQSEEPELHAKQRQLGQTYSHQLLLIC